jgi:hypothetical protein
MIYVQENEQESMCLVVIIHEKATTGGEFEDTDRVSRQSCPQFSRTSEWMNEIRWFSESNNSLFSAYNSYSQKSKLKILKSA